MVTRGRVSDMANSGAIQRRLVSVAQLVALLLLATVAVSAGSSRHPAGLALQGKLIVPSQEPGQEFFKGRRLQQGVPASSPPAASPPPATPADTSSDSISGTKLAVIVGCSVAGFAVFKTICMVMSWRIWKKRRAAKEAERLKAALAGAGSPTTTASPNETMTNDSTQFVTVQLSTTAALAAAQEADKLGAIGKDKGPSPFVRGSFKETPFNRASSTQSPFVRASFGQSQKGSSNQSPYVQGSSNDQTMSYSPGQSGGSGPALKPAASNFEAYQAVLKQTITIPWESIQIGRVLGKGGFGNVYQGTWQGDAVAVKMLNFKQLSSHAQDQLRAEALAMCELRHPSIAQVFGLVDDNEHTALVMRYYKRGTVAAAVQSADYPRLPLAQRLKMALQVASGMRFLHSKQLLHGDLKTSNLLVEDTGRGVVLADFGLSCVAGQAPLSGAFTASISPPEVLQDPNAPRTPAGDVYAYAMVLLEIMTGRTAYKGTNFYALKYLVCEGKRPEIGPEVPAGIAFIINACWAHQASDRPSFVEVMRMLEAECGTGAEPNPAPTNPLYQPQLNPQLQPCAIAIDHTYTLSDLTATHH